MSDTFSIACKDCKEHLWIGQGAHDYSSGGLAHLHLYTSKKHREALTDFFKTHHEHSLVFFDNCRSYCNEYKEIEVKEITG